MNLIVLHGRVETHGRIGGQRLQRNGVFRLIGRRPGQSPLAVTPRHADRAIDQIAQVVGQIGIVTRLEPFLVEIGILAGGDVAHQVVTQSVRAVAVGQGIGINHIARALAHLGTAEIPPSVNEQLRHDLDSGRLQHDRPVDAVSRDENVFADDMRIAGPEFFEVRQLAAIARAITGERRVVHQRVEPNVGYEVAVEGKLDAPTQPRFWS